MATRKPMDYYGGKVGMVDEIARNFPPLIDRYVEPFCGSASVFFAADGRWASQEILNDLNGDLTCFYRMLRDHPDEMIRRLQLTPHSRREYEDAALAIRTRKFEDDYHRALCFFIRIVQSFHGSTHGWDKTDRDRWISKTDPGQLFAAATRLRMASIENRPYDFILKTYDSPGTLFYLDPPYLSTNSPKDMVANYHGLGMTEEDHSQFLSKVRTLKGYAVISGYPHPLYDSLVQDGWDEIKIHRSSTVAISSQDKNVVTERTEVLWVNPRARSTRRQPSLW